jgi:hypothetical protein
MLQENPNLAVQPDFTLQEHQLAHQQLVDGGFMDDQAARSLAVLWTLANNADKERWNLRQERLQEAREREEEEEEQRQQLRREEAEAARLEDRKKNKNKYAPLVRGKAPSDPTILLAQYTTRKLKAGDYCEFHYFTNKGLEDAQLATLVAEPDAMVMLPSSEGIHSWIPAAAVKDPKATPVIKDKHLSWEEFNEAAPRMVTSMRQYDWPEERVEMHIQFWYALQAHRWRHSPDLLKKRALLLYQSQQRRRWHQSIGTAKSWSLEELNNDLIVEAREELFNEKCERETKIAIHVSFEAPYE